MTRRQLKAELKHLAVQIKTKRPAYRKAQSTNTSTWQMLAELEKAVYEFRHRHIAYCTLRGRLRDQIEKPRPENKPNEKYVADLIIAYSGVADAQAVCSVQV
jgi:hypothetical protein